MRKETDIALAIGRCGFFRSSVDLLLQEVEEAVKARKTVVILTGSADNSKKMKEMIVKAHNSVQNITISSRYHFSWF